MKKSLNYFRLVFLRIFKIIISILGFTIYLFLCIFHPIEYIFVGDKKGLLDWIGNKLEQFIQWEPK